MQMPGGMPTFPRRIIEITSLTRFPYRRTPILPLKAIIGNVAAALYAHIIPITVEYALQKTNFNKANEISSSLTIQ